MIRKFFDIYDMNFSLYDIKYNSPRIIYANTMRSFRIINEFFIMQRLQQIKILCGFDRLKKIDFFNHRSYNGRGVNLTRSRLKKGLNSFIRESYIHIFTIVVNKQQITRQKRLLPLLIHHIRLEINFKFSQIKCFCK